LSFLILKQFATSLRGPIVPQASKLLEVYATLALTKPRLRSAGARYGVVAFDLDGTLLRGFDFSWTLVWKHLNFPEAVWKAGMQNYLNGKTTYQQWCEWACSQYRLKGLKRSHFKAICKDLKLTANFQETLNILRNNGFIVAILSGGIDVILRETIPNADEVFDYICINHLQFDDQDIISGVTPTPFDFAGKATALEAICHKHDVKLSESVFVGEGFNDEFVAGKAGLTVAYPPKQNGFGFASRVEIKEDNLLKILDHVL
jgi:phosphoserine phosphatase